MDQIRLYESSFRLTPENCGYTKIGLPKQIENFEAIFSFKEYALSSFLLTDTYMNTGNHFVGVSMLVYLRLEQFLFLNCEINSRINSLGTEDLT